MTDSKHEKYKGATLICDTSIGGKKFPWTWYYSDTTIVSSTKTKEMAMYLIDMEDEIRQKNVFDRLKKY